MQFLGLASLAGVLAIAGVSAASTLRNQGTSETTSEGSVTAESRAVKPAPAPKQAAPIAEPVVQQSAAVTPRVETPQPTTETPSTPAPAEPAPVPRAGFVVVEGRTQLSDSVVAIRTGDSVVVNFDAFGYRTRRASRLENSLRETLPLVFGKRATASIDTIKAGELVINRDVIGELATNGMRVTLDNGAIAHIRVVTRIVSDGPIAIGYVATIER